MAALLLAPGQRPDADRIEAIARSAGVFTVSHRDAGPAEWVEVLRDGLTFDLTGLSPGAPLPAVHDDAAARTSAVGLPASLDLAMLEAVGLAPGPHLLGAEHLLPVIRVAARIITHLAKSLDAKAILWKPSGSAVSPEWFEKACNAWIEGGPFPAIAMTTFARTESELTSRGLAFLIGQEFRLYSSGGILQEEDARVSVRLVDWLVAHGKVEGPREVVLSGVGAVRLEPNADGLIHVRSA
ncbi:hypothetical protein [Novosphingobium huizhouense]|uniref:hypothetical protein n=1 Tax=Novosphingobium huizhouense TaxID=2866625 RepID=UPI001CD85347|nr:hypothetical protein [Novosphingobium huizhouense]